MWRWRVGAVLVVACNACVNASYRPVSAAAQPVSGGHVRPVQIVRREPIEDEITVETELAPGTSLLRAGFAGQDDGCPDPIASLQTIDGVPRHRIEPPLFDGHRTLSLNLAVSERQALSLETERLGVRACDVVQIGWPRQWERAPFWFADARISYLDSDISVAGLRLLLARWAGRLRLGVELGVTNAVVCEDDSDCPNRFALPLALEAAATAYSDSVLFVLLGARPLLVLTQAEANAKLEARSLAVQAVLELMVGGSARKKDVAPSGGTLSVGISAGPALPLLGPDAELGLALGFQLGYGLAP